MILDLSTHTRVMADVVSTVLDADDRRAHVFTVADPIPARRIAYSDPNRRYDDHSSARWDQDGPTFSHVKRVQHTGWLRRVASGYGEPALLHPSVGTAFYVKGWRYRYVQAGVACDIDRHDPILIARLSDGRIFAQRWADASVLYDYLSRWRNARGYLCDWDAHYRMTSPPTCAIGGLDWKSIDPSTTRTTR